MQIGFRAAVGWRQCWRATGDGTEHSRSKGRRHCEHRLENRGTWGRRRRSGCLRCPSKDRKAGNQVDRTEGHDGRPTEEREGPFTGHGGASDSEERTRSARVSPGKMASYKWLATAKVRRKQRQTLKLETPPLRIQPSS